MFVFFGGFYPASTQHSSHSDMPNLLLLTASRDWDVKQSFKWFFFTALLWNHMEYAEVSCCGHYVLFVIHITYAAANFSYVIAVTYPNSVPVFLHQF